MIRKVSLLLVLVLMAACGAKNVSATYQVQSEEGFQKRGPATVCYANESETDLDMLAMAADIISSLRSHDIYPAEEAAEACDIRFTLEEQASDKGKTVLMRMARGDKLSTASVTADSKSWRNSAPLLRELALAYGGNDKWQLSCTTVDNVVNCKKYMDREPQKANPADQVPSFIKPGGGLRY